MKNCFRMALVFVLMMSPGIMVASRHSINSQAANPASPQESITVKGTVTGDGEPIVGATVVWDGTTTGTVTDIDGHYTLNIAPDATIVVSFIGYETVKTAVNGRSEININLKSAAQALDEVVVVGYGTQKKKLVTGSTVQVKGESIAKLNTVDVLGAMQGQTPGVNITSANGQPGAGFKMNIRGLGTIGDAEPLVVIDGMAGGDINMLNPSDIESIDVLKDAASSAIYGSRAANGVILVTTKQGKAGKLQLSFDAYYGWQNPAKMPETLTAQQTMALTNESRFMNGQPALDWNEQLGGRVCKMIQDGWNGTNWLEEMRVKNAATQNYAVSLNGGSEVSRFALGFSYTSQDGIFGKPRASQYDRYTARVNSDHSLVRVNGRDVLKIGENVSFYHSSKNGIEQRMLGFNDIEGAIKTTPLLPMYNADGTYYTQADKMADGWNYNPEEYNPILVIAKNRGNNLTRNWGLTAQAYVDFEPIKNLRYHSAFSYRYGDSSYRKFIEPYIASTNQSSDAFQVTQEMESKHNISVENTISYKLPEFGGHAIDVLVGQSYEHMAYGEHLHVENSVAAGSQLSTLQPDMDHAWISNTANVLGSTVLRGKPMDDWTLVSFFGRLNYSFKERYMLTAIIRSDGSSNFARGHRWGYFPSVSAGWVVTEENFMQGAKSWLDMLKIRASYGRNGNQNIDNFQYVSPVAFDNSHVYNFGPTILSTTGQKSVGAFAKSLANTGITWEKSQQIDVGLDATMLGSRLRLNFDWYKKTTKDWLVQAPVLDAAGTAAPYINGGDVDNKGFEIGLAWNDKAGRDFQYGVNVNLSYNKNEVTRIANPEGIIHGDAGVLSKTSNEFYRAQVGQPIGYFWGLKTAGVFQNQAQIDAWRAAGNGFANANPRPGDIAYVDYHHDGKIDELDKTKIGDPNPDFRLGLGINMSYKGLDFNLAATGAFGQQVLFTYRSATTYAFDRWHGEGTSNRYGIATKPDDLDATMLEDADFLRIQSLSLGYDFKKLFPRIPFSQLRLYVSGQNLYTFTGYKGMDPEVGFGGNNLQGDGRAWMSGIDIGSYPAPRTFLIGLNIKY